MARERFAGEGLKGTFLLGTAEQLDRPDSAFDVIVSVFALIFSSDPERAAAKLMRGLSPGGRALVTAWVPEGAVADAFGTVGRSVAALLPEPPPERFAWGEQAVVRELFEGAGAAVSIESFELAVEAGSAPEFAERFFTRHPMGVRARDALEAGGRYEAVRHDAIAVLEKWNEDPGAFRATSRYLVASLTRS